MTFLEEIQSLEESTKRKVLIIATVIIMVIVIYLWLAYFNTIVAGGVASQSAALESSSTITSTPLQVAAPTSGGTSMWQGMYEDFLNIFRASRQYNVQPTN